MPSNPRHYKCGEDYFLLIQQIAPQEFGEAEYSITFNKEGRPLVIIREGNDAQEARGEIDIVWKTVTEALDVKRNQELASKGLANKESTYLRIERFQDQDIVTHTICFTECGVGGEDCGDDVKVDIRRKIAPSRKPG